jgi:hypothetical protein
MILRLIYVNLPQLMKTTKHFELCSYSLPYDRKAVTAQ